MRKYRLAIICCLAATALVSLMLTSGCKDVFNRLPGIWTITITYDRGEFIMDAEFSGSEEEGVVVIGEIGIGEYRADGVNVSFTNNYTHANFGATTDNFTGVFDTGITMSGTGTVTYHDENRSAPITWSAVKRASFD